MDPRAETHLRLLAEARLRRAVTAPHRIHLDQDFAIGGQPPREEGIYKVAAAAQALELVGAVSSTTAARVMSEFTAALAVRAIEDPSGLVPGRPRRNSAGPAADSSRELVTGPGTPARAGLSPDEGGTRAEPAGGPACPVTQAGTPAPAGELLLDAVAQALLGGGLMPGINARLLAFGLTEVVDALETVGALPPDSPATAHVAALCQQCGFDVGPVLATRAAAAHIPAHWASVLEHRDSHDGRDDAAPVAAVLPAIEGARFTLAGLRSTGRLSVIRVLAWGWRPDPRRFRRDQPLSWWARDSAGRWHVGRPVPAGHPGHDHDGSQPAPAGASFFRLELLPALDPTATSLDVFVTGAAATVSVTVPLAWQAQG